MLCESHLKSGTSCGAEWNQLDYTDLLLPVKSVLKRKLQVCLQMCKEGLRKQSKGTCTHSDFASVSVLCSKIVFIFPSY